MQRNWILTIVAGVVGAFASCHNVYAQTLTLTDDSPAIEVANRSYFQDTESSFSDAPSPPETALDDAPAGTLSDDEGTAETKEDEAAEAPSVKQVAPPAPVKSLHDEPSTRSSVSDSGYSATLDYSNLSCCDDDGCAGGSCCDDSGCAGGSCGGCGGESSWGELGDPIEVFGTHECSGLHVGGWVQAGYTTYNTTLFNNHPYSVDLNQAWIFMEKVADTSEKDLDFGFRVDYMYGSDGPDTQAFGEPAPQQHWDNQWDHGNFYGHAIPQLYGEVAYNNVSVKVGHFYTTIGYEVVTAPDNFFYSHAFTMYLSEPFTHTGALATMTVGDNVTVHGGYTFGWDTGFDRFNGDTVLAGVSVDLGDSVTATYAATAGNRGFGTAQQGYSHSIVLDVTLTESLNYVLQSDYVDYNNNGQNTFRTVGVNQYFLYTINDMLQAGVRAEWWQNRSVAQNYSDVYGLTAGLNIRPHANLVIRPEVRYDMDKDGIMIPAAHNNRAGFGIDAIVTF